MSDIRGQVVENGSQYSTFVNFSKKEQEKQLNPPFIAETNAIV
jgi:hypothetical protein